MSEHHYAWESPPTPSGYRVKGSVGDLFVSLQVIHRMAGQVKDGKRATLWCVISELVIYFPTNRQACETDMFRHLDGYDVDLRPHVQKFLEWFDRLPDTPQEQSVPERQSMN
jgi:hypothetical protein